MGGGKWTSDDYTSYARSTSYITKSTAEIFGNRSIPKELDPKLIKLRESCDSEDNPNSTPVILALDVTGSMGEYAGKIARDALPALMTSILEDLPVTDPHVMFMGIDDVHTYRGQDALQVSQFEADIRILQQLREIFIVGGGGGNRSESYDLPWYFAAKRTQIDSFQKRGQKGFLFTFGDEEAPYETLSEKDLALVFGPGQYEASTPAATLAAAREKYHVFHVCIEQGGGFDRRAESTWTELMGTSVLFLRDFRDLNEVVTSTMRIVNGADINEVIRASKNPDSLRHAFKNALASGN